MEKVIRVLIIDDEPLGRRMVRRMLDALTGIEIVGECQTGLEAISKIRADEPDLVFLDVQMPNIDGFGVLEQIAEDKQPAVVFVTAYDEYAIRAFEVNAVDYLLKPYDRERFEQAFQRAVLHMRHRNTDRINEQLRAFLLANKPSEPFSERILVKSGGRVYFLKTEEIHYIQSEGNYVMLYTQKSKHLFRETISKVEETLNPQKFQRIGRSTIVNIDYVKELQPFFRGNYQVILLDGTRLKLSQHYRRQFNEHFVGSL